MHLKLQRIKELLNCFSSLTGKIEEFHRCNIINDKHLEFFHAENSIEEVFTICVVIFKAGKGRGRGRGRGIGRGREKSVFTFAYTSTCL